MLDKIDKYIFSIIAKYICSKYFRVLSKKYTNYGQCKLLHLSVDGYKYFGCSVHSNLSYNTINSIINKKGNNYRFISKMSADLAKHIIYDTSLKQNCINHQDKCGFYDSRELNIIKIKNKYKARKVNTLPFFSPPQL